MSKKPETTFGEYVDAQLTKAFGKLIWIENIQQAAKCGTPDRLICLVGRFVAIELKTDEGQLSRIQIVKLAEIRRAGGYAFVASPSTWHDVFSILSKLYSDLLADLDS